MRFVERVWTRGIGLTLGLVLVVSVAASTAQAQPTGLAASFEIEQPQLNPGCLLVNGGALRPRR